jgi:hypothetical protein
MKASELRIGNWYNEFGMPKQATPNLIFNLYHIGLAGKIAIDCTPIPLTPEILLKSGFEAFDDGWYILESFTWNIYDKLIRWNSFQLKCQYLHQLQNLYFALTGEELEISL